MSQFFSEDWEDAPASPWVITATTMARPAAVFDGSFDLLLSTTTGAGTWQFFMPGGTRGFGSARGGKIQARFKFRFQNVTPVTGSQVGLIYTNGIIGVFINDGSFVICLQGVDLSQSFGATTLVRNQEYLLEWELRYEVDTGSYQRVWLDGALEVEHRDPVGSAPAGGQHNFCEGGIGGPKGSTVLRWGDMFIWVGSDPQ